MSATPLVAVRVVAWAARRALAHEAPRSLTGRTPPPSAAPWWAVEQRRVLTGRARAGVVALAAAMLLLAAVVAANPRAAVVGLVLAALGMLAVDRRRTALAREHAPDDRER